MKTDIPDGQAFDEDFNKVMANYQGMLGQNILQLAIQHPDCDELKLVKEIITEKTGREIITTEDKLVKIAQVVYPPLKACIGEGKQITGNASRGNDGRDLKSSVPLQMKQSALTTPSLRHWWTRNF